MGWDFFHVVTCDIVTRKILQWERSDFFWTGTSVEHLRAAAFVLSTKRVYATT